jgi:hypothetical protein
MSKLPSLVDDYARRIYGAVCAQQSGQFVASPLGVWLLLAVIAPGAPDEYRTELEIALGCPAEEATDLVAQLLADPPRALALALAVWVRDSERTAALSRWEEGLSSKVDRGSMPNQAEADEWVRDRTLGLIGSYPYPLEKLLAVMTSALATRVSWVQPFRVVRSSELGPESPWRAAVDWVLLAEGRDDLAIVETQSAGTVAVHSGLALEGLRVLSVIAAPEVGRPEVLAAAHQAASVFSTGHGESARRIPLAELALGEGHAWTLEERTERTPEPGAVVEDYRAVLPAWEASGSLDLLEDPAFAAAPAAAALRRLLPEDAGPLAARQVAVASYTRYGFEAAAITSIGVAVSAKVMRHEGIRRIVTIRFNRPYAIVAVVEAPHDRTTGQPLASSLWIGLPAFSSWVSEAINAEGD